MTDKKDNSLKHNPPTKKQLKYPPPSPDSHSQDADRHHKIKHTVSDK